MAPSPAETWGSGVPCSHRTRSQYQSYGSGLRNPRFVAASTSAAMLGPAEGLIGSLCLLDLDILLYTPLTYVPAMGPDNLSRSIKRDVLSRGSPVTMQWWPMVPYRIRSVPFRRHLSLALNFPDYALQLALDVGNAKRQPAPALSVFFIVIGRRRPRAPSDW